MVLLLIFLSAGIIFGIFNKRKYNLHIKGIGLFGLGISILCLANVLALLTNINILISSQIISTVLLIIFGVFNRKIVFVLLIVLGHSLNSIVMVFNNGKMPVKMLECIKTYQFDNRHFFIDENTKFYYLSDIIHFPNLYNIEHNIFSVGDIILFLGMTIFIFNIFSRNINIKITGVWIKD